MNKKAKILICLLIAVQLLLGIGLILFSIYLDEYYYLDLENFFMHFMHIPGAALILMNLHYLIYKDYKTPGRFVFTGIFGAFMVTITGEFLVILRAMFPEGWVSYILWFIIAGIITAIIAGIFHILYMIIMNRYSKIS